MWGEEDGIGERREGNQVHQPGGQKYKRVGIIKMSGLYKEDTSGTDSPASGQESSRCCNPYPIETEGLRDAERTWQTGQF